MSVGALAGYLVLFELAKDVANLETFLQVVILICIDQLKVFATVKDDGVVLIVRLSVSENWITGKFDLELWSPFSCLNVELGVAINERGKEPRISSLLLGGFLEVYHLEFGVCTEKKFCVFVFLLVELRVSLHGNNELKLSPRHRFQLAFELVGVPSKSLDDLGIFDAVEEFDSFPVVHHTGNSSVECLGTKRGPNPGAEREFWRGALETDAVEGKIVRLRDLFVPKRSRPIVHRRFFCKDFRVLDKVVPLDRVQLLQVLKERDPGVLVLLANDFSQRQQNLP